MRDNAWGGGTTYTEPSPRRRIWWRHSPPARVGAPVLFVALALAATWPFAHVGPAASYQLFVAAVLLSAWYGGLASGLWASFLSILVTTFILVGPRYKFAIDGFSDLISIIAFSAISGLVILLTELRERGEQARLRAEREARALDQALRVHAETFEALLRMAPLGIGIAQDPECRVIRANEAFARMLGVAPGENASKTPNGPSALRFTVLSEGREIAGDDLPIQEAARTKRPVPPRELEVVRGDGTRITIFGGAIPLFSPEGGLRGAIGTFMDVTELRRLTDEREDLLQRERDARIQLERLYRDALELQEHLQRSNEFKDEFLGIVSHELRTPITIIRVASKLLARYGEEMDSSQSEAVHELYRESMRMERVVEDLLVLGRGDERVRVEPEPVSLRPFLVRAAADSQLAFPERRVRVIGGHSVIVLAVPSYLEQVLRNLLSNADKFSPPGAVIEVRARVHGAEVILSVLDRGPGVPGSELRRIFDRYYQSGGSAQRLRGVGMGLTVCKRLVEAQSGHIWAEARRKHGLAVRFTLPLYREAA